MGTYISSVIFVFAFVVGLIISSTIIFYILGNRKPKVKKAKVSKKKKADKKPKKESVSESYEYESGTDLEEEKGLLKKRLGGERESWKEFNCIADGIEEHDSIKDSQKKEDSSYHYIKRKGQK